MLFCNNQKQTNFVNNETIVYTWILYDHIVEFVSWYTCCAYPTNKP